MNLLGKGGQTALIKAAGFKTTEFPKLPLEAGADVNIVCAFGLMAVSLEGRRNGMDVCYKLFDTGADVNQRPRVL